LAFYLARLSVIDDEIAENELHLLRLCPTVWFSSDQETVFEKMPTLYGTVHLRFRVSEDRQTLSVSFSGQWREKPRRIVLHAPPLGLTHVVINGKREPARAQILL
jgi:hypothetical protein